MFQRQSRISRGNSSRPQIAQGLGQLRPRNLLSMFNQETAVATAEDEAAEVARRLQSALDPMDVDIDDDAMQVETIKTF